MRQWLCMKIRMKRIWCRNLPQKAPDSDVQRLPVRPLGKVSSTMVPPPKKAAR